MTNLSFLFQYIRVACVCVCAAIESIKSAQWRNCIDTEVETRTNTCTQTVERTTLDSFAASQLNGFTLLPRIY